MDHMLRQAGHNLAARRLRVDCDLTNLQPRHIDIGRFLALPAISIDG